MATSIKTTTVRMIANFEKGIFLPMVGELANPVALHEKLKTLGAALGRHSIDLLLEGKEAMLRGFEVVTVNDKHLAPPVAAKRGDMPDVETHTREKGGYKPAGAIQSVRPGSQIAKGMEALVNGATVAELRKVLEHPSDDATMSFLMYRPKKRGYGLRKDGDKYFLVFPEGVDKISYK